MAQAFASDTRTLHELGKRVEYQLGVYDDALRRDIVEFRAGVSDYASAQADRVRTKPSRVADSAKQRASHIAGAPGRAVGAARQKVENGIDTVKAAPANAVQAAKAAPRKAGKAALNAPSAAVKGTGRAAKGGARLAKKGAAFAGMPTSAWGALKDQLGVSGKGVMRQATEAIGANLDPDQGGVSELSSADGLAGTLAAVKKSGTAAKKGAMFGLNAGKGGFKVADAAVDVAKKGFKYAITPWSILGDVGKHLSQKAQGA